MEEVFNAIKQIEKDNWLEVLRQPQTVKDRLKKLMELLPEIRLWSAMHAKQLVFYLQRAYKIDFGVCDFYTMEREKQYCTASGDKVECHCAIPEAYCALRDMDGKAKYPEFSFVRVLKGLQYWRLH